MFCVSRRNPPVPDSASADSYGRFNIIYLLARRALTSSFLSLSIRSAITSISLFFLSSVSPFLVVLPLLPYHHL